MISANNLSVYFSGIPLFRDLNFVIGDNERIGLVGKNGAGKTTLLRILAHELEPESGSIVITKGFRIGYLPQEMRIETGKSVWEKTYEAFDEIRSIDSEIDALNSELAERKDYTSDEYSKIIERLNLLDNRRQYLGAANIESDMDV